MVFHEVALDVFELIEKELLLVATHYLDKTTNTLEENGDQEATEKIDRYHNRSGIFSTRPISESNRHSRMLIFDEKHHVSTDKIRYGNTT